MQPPLHPEHLQPPLFGLIGYPLTHTASPEIFKQKFLELGLQGHEYKAFSIAQLASLDTLLQNHPHLQGFNVTVPFKEEILPRLQALTPLAKEIGAVNCVWRKGSLLYGHNTDALAFFHSLSVHKSTSPRALILGDGGSAQAVKWALRQHQISYTSVVRRQPKAFQITYQQLDGEHISAHPLIINTTPLGMFPSVQAAPAIPYEFLTPHHFCYDLIYNPAQTLFLFRAKSFGAKTQNGQQMLQLQADASWAFWQNPEAFFQKDFPLDI